MNWKDRLADGRPPLRIGEFAKLTGWSDDTIRKQINTGAVKTVAFVRGGERRVPVRVAREIAVGLEITV